MKKILIGILAMLFVLAACNAPQSADTMDEPAGNQMDDESNQAMDETSDDMMEETPDEMMDEPDTMASSQASDLLSEFFTDKQRLSYYVAYNMQSTSQGQQTSGTMAMYLKDERNLRTDVNSQGTEARTYLKDDKYYVCSQSGSTWQCFSATQQKSEGERMQEDIESNPQNYDVTALPDRTIAGVTTKCFRITTSDGTVDYCFSPEGVPLHISTSAEGSSTDLTATSYRTSVSDSDLELPQGAQTQSMDDLMAQYGGYS